MTPSDFLSTILIPDLQWLASAVPGIPVSESAVALMCATAGQEARIIATHRNIWVLV